MTDAQKVKAAELKEAELNETGHLTPEPTVTPMQYLCAQISPVIESAPEEKKITINSDLHQSYPGPISELGSRVVHKQTNSHRFRFRF
jgi:hypothetical protein